MNKRRVLTWSAIVIVFLAGLGLIFRERVIGWFFRPTASTVSRGEVDRQKVQELASGLKTPWEVAVLPDGEDKIISQRDGSLRLLKDDRTYPVGQVQTGGEGGLLGMALHPDFKSNRWVYTYFTTSQEGRLTNRVERYRLTDDTLAQKTVILADIPAAANHDGGRIAFGPDGKLYIGTGDAQRTELAQDTTSLAGKVLRVNDDGSTPADNPFRNPVYSYGHRNVQGLAWDGEGRLWATEHGPSGSESGYDELNLIRRGANYGWPAIRGDERREGMQAPVANSGSDDTWAPAGLAYADGSLYFAGLRGQSVYRAKLNGDAVALTAYYRGDYGRLRAVVRDGDALLVTTSNTDGRGTPRDNDDRLLRLPLDSLR